MHVSILIVCSEFPEFCASGLFLGTSKYYFTFQVIVVTNFISNLINSYFENIDYILHSPWKESRISGILGKSVGQPIKCSISIFLKIVFIYLFYTERKGGRKRGRETPVCGCLLQAPHQGLDPAHNPGMCPDWESNR